MGGEGKETGCDSLLVTRWGLHVLVIMLRPSSLRTPLSASLLNAHHTPTTASHQHLEYACSLLPPTNPTTHTHSTPLHSQPPLPTNNSLSVQVPLSEAVVAGVKLRVGGTLLKTKGVKGGSKVTVDLFCGGVCLCQCLGGGGEGGRKGTAETHTYEHTHRARTHSSSSSRDGETQPHWPPHTDNAQKSQCTRTMHTPNAHILTMHT